WLFLSFEHYSLSMPRLKVLRFPDFHLKNIDIAFYFVVFVFEHFPLGYHWKPESLSSRLKTVRRLLYLIVQYLNQANLIQQLLFLSFDHYSLSMPRLKVLRFPDFHLKNIDIAFYFVVFVFDHFPLGYHWKPESLSSRLKTVRRLLYLIVQYLNQANLIQQLLF